MAKNRKRNVQMGAVPKLLVGVVVLVSLGALVFWSVDSKCNALCKEINLLQQEHTGLENVRSHEEARWLAKLSPENLDRTIREMGLPMDYPSADQIVVIDAEGKPLPNQTSLARFKKIVASGNLAAH